MLPSTLIIGTTWCPLYRASLYTCLEHLPARLHNCSLGINTPILALLLLSLFFIIIVVSVLSDHRKGVACYAHKIKLKRGENTEENRQCFTLCETWTSCPRANFARMCLAPSFLSWHDDRYFTQRLSIPSHNGVCWAAFGIGLRLTGTERRALIISDRWWYHNISSRGRERKRTLRRQPIRFGNSIERLPKLNFDDV